MIDKKLISETANEIVWEVFLNGISIGFDTQTKEVEL